MVRRMAPVKGLSDSQGCHGAAGLACVVTFFRRCPR